MNDTCVFAGQVTMHCLFNNTATSDLYEKLVAPYLGLGLKVESWRHEQSEPSVCNGSVFWVSSHSDCLPSARFV